MYIDISLERWTIRKLMAGAGEGGEVQKKKILPQGKIKLKKSYTPRNSTNYSCIGLRKSYKGNVNEKNSCGSKISHPHDFLMVRPLALYKQVTTKT